MVAQYEARRPEVKQARKARYRGRLLNARGSFTREEWEARKIQFGNRCAYCGRKTKHLTPDHYIPLSRGGTNLIDNIIPACPYCNRHKWSSDPSTFEFPRRTQMIFAQLQLGKEGATPLSGTPVKPTGGKEEPGDKGGGLLKKNGKNKGLTIYQAV